MASAAFFEMTATTINTGVTGTLAAVADLSAGDRWAMRGLLERHFNGVTPVGFEADLAGKNWALLLHGPGGLVGFSTMAVYESAAGGEVATVVCSGDTIVDPSAWGSAALPREWIAAVGRLRARYPHGPLQWLLLTSGFRTYRLLSTFWQDFHPRFDRPTPAEVRRRMDGLAVERFGAAYRDGVVRFDRPQVLRPALAGIPASRRADPHVAFFAGRNPGHGDGDELVCLCELAEGNLTRAGRRVVRGAGA